MNESISFLRLTRAGSCAALLFGAVAAQGCASAEIPALRTEGAAPAAEATRFRVERNGFSKKITFEDADGPGAVTVKYKGIPIAWGSPINLLVDEDLYEKQSHRVRYRFQHPLSARPVVLVARAKSEHVASLPLRGEGNATVVRLFDGEETAPWGTLRYDFDSRVLFSGDIDRRLVEIERVSPDTALDKALLKYLLFPFPISGDFVVRVDGREAARFTEHRARGFKSPYDLTFDGELDPATRDVAMMAFLVFDLMKDFVQVSAS